MPVIGCIECANTPATPVLATASVFVVDAANLAATWADEADVAAIWQWPVLRQKRRRTRPLYGNNYARSVEAGALLELKHPLESIVARMAGRSGEERGRVALNKKRRMAPSNEETARQLTDSSELSHEPAANSKISRMLR